MTADPEKYSEYNRVWQGIPGIEKTDGGRLYYCFYTGSNGEMNGNFVMLYRSDNDADGPFEPYLVVEAPTENTRAFDPCPWIDNKGRLWLFYAQSYGLYDGRVGVWAIVCDDPDADEPRFSEPRRLANGIMMNKPIIADDGSWLICCSIWSTLSSEHNFLPEERYPNVYRSTNEGDSFELIGHSDYSERSLDEHMMVQLKDGRLWMLIRAKDGIGQSFSDDRGVTWYNDSDSGIGGPNSRFCIRRLGSGNLILVNHHEFTGRNNLKAMISRDEGKTWEGYLLLDERDGVSYPDLKQDENGMIYIAYDHKRVHEKEFYLAKVTEEDILAGKLVNESSRLKVLVHKGYLNK